MHTQTTINSILTRGGTRHFHLRVMLLELAMLKPNYYYNYWEVSKADYAQVFTIYLLIYS